MHYDYAVIILMIHIAETTNILLVVKLRQDINLFVFGYVPMAPKLVSISEEGLLLL